MTKYIKRHRSQLGRVSVVVLTIGALLALHMYALLFVGTASAAQLTNRSVTIGDSDFSVATSYVFVFTLATALTTDAGAGADASFNLDFPEDAGGDPFTMPNFAAGDATVTCTSCASQVMAVTAVVESDGGGAMANDDVYVAVNETGQDSAPIPVGSVITLTLGTGATLMTNPADNAAGCTVDMDAGDADVCSITVEAHDDGTATSLSDDGDVLAAFVGDVTVTVTVEENLTFFIDGVTNAACEASFSNEGDIADTTPAAVDFGNISTFESFFNGCQDLSIVTNALNGYVITAETDTSLQDGTSTEIDSGVCDGTCNATTEDTWTDPTEATGDTGLAYSCDTITDDDAGNVCNVTETTGYKRFACTGAAADCSPSNSEAPHTVMSDTGTGNDVGRIEYKLSVSGTQPAAIYTTQVTYIATPTF